MQTGYSILLGEYINADAISYRDCEPFQIVCPTCHEPVFKVARSADDNAIEYLSHYKQSGSYDSDCELRVASTPSSEREQHNSQSRDQKLSYFLSVFRSALEQDPYVSYSKGLEYSHKRINRSKALCLFREQHFEIGRKGGMAERTQFQDAAEFYLKEVSEFGGVPKTGFSMATQTRIASDMMKLLITGQGKPNYNALFNHSAVYLLQRYQTRASNETAERIEVAENIAYFVSGLIQSGKKAGMQLIADMHATPIYPPHVEAPATYLLKVATEIGHEMIGTLLRLPYFELLKQKQLDDKKLT
jgi:hypothetical protein